MKELFKKAVFFGALGCIMGLAIGIVLWLVGDPSASSARADISNLILYLVVSGVYGMIAMGSSVVYDIEEWSIAKATTTHFIVTLVGFYALGMIEGWLQFGDAVFCIMTISFVVIYFVIWFVQYLSFKRVVQNMNNDLKKMKDAEKK